MGSSQEREIPSQKARARRPRERLPLPKPVEVLVRNEIDGIDRVGILEDDTYVVFWGDKDNLTPNRHATVWRILRQGQALLDNYLGVPVGEGQAVSAPRFGITLPDFARRVKTTGRIERAQTLASNAMRVVADAQNPQVPMAQVQEGLTWITNQLSPHVRNIHKVRARGNFQEGSQTETRAETQKRTLSGAQEMFLLVHDGASICSAIIERNGRLIVKIDEKKQVLGYLKTSLGAALREIDTIVQGFTIGRPVSEVDIESSMEAWQRGLFSDTGSNVLRPVLELRGNPFALGKRREIVRLGELEPAFATRNIPFIKEAFESAHNLLLRQLSEIENELREWERYRLPQSRT